MHPDCLSSGAQGSTQRHVYLGVHDRDVYEVELKVEAVHDAVRPRLEDLDADRLGAARQVDTYFDAPDRDFAETDEALRIRRETPDDGDQRAVVTYKGPLVEAASKTRREAETQVGDAEAMTAVLDGLGFEPAATVRKDREQFALDQYEVVLDAVEGLGEFVEVEAEAEDEIEPIRAGAESVLRDLGLDPADGIRTSYLGLLRAADGERDEAQ